MLKVRLLGGYNVKWDDKPVVITSRPAQSLFAHLILTAGTYHRREKLAGLLWPDSSEENARDYLRHGLWRLRKAVENKSNEGDNHSYILADDISVAFNADAPYFLDVAIIEKVDVDRATTDGLMEALSLYEGELLPGFYDEWAILEREHLQAVFEKKMECLVYRLQTEARWLEDLDWCERWISLGQTPEAAYRFLMMAHAARGDMSKVVTTFERCTKSLSEFGVEPSEQTQILYKNLKSGKEKFEKEPLVEPVVKIKRTAPTSNTNLPVPLTSFIGREKEIDEVVNLLDEKRLLTLTGSGGVGKTRLAIKCANRVLSSFRDGVWWVDLVSLTDPLLVPQSVAKVVNVHEVSDQPLIQTLVGHFQSKQALIVLNNCEHLISACAQLADQLLSTCAELKIMTTSREALDILGETIWQVPSLTLPDMESTVNAETLNKFESVRLFIERALAVQPACLLTDLSAGAVAKICRRLSGMPLAIELAAARTKIMSPDEIALRLNDRFDLLTSGNRTALPRHQTLRATIDWSYDLLSETEKVLFRRLSVFVGGFTLEAAEAITGGWDISESQVVFLLERLVNKSLIVVEASSGDQEDETRYRMLETIREYAYEKLEYEGGKDAMRDRHLEYFVAYAEEAERNTFGDKTVSWLRRLDKEIDNIRAAVDWSIESEKAIEALRLVGALIFFRFQAGSPSGWQERLDTVLALPGGRGQTPERAKALYGIGLLYWSDVNPVDKTPELQEALSIGKHLGDKFIIANALSNLGLFACLQNDLEKARLYLEQSLDLFEEIEPAHKWEFSEAHIYMGDVAFGQNCVKEARMHYERSVKTLREAGDRFTLALAVRRLGQLALHEGNSETAITYCNESLDLNVKAEDQRGILACVSALAGIALVRGQAKAAAQLFGSVKALLSAVNIRFLRVDRIEYERHVSMLRSQLEQESFENAWAEGATMTTEQAVEFALNLIK